MGKRLHTTIETLEELSQYLNVDSSLRFVVAVDEAVRILKNVDKLVSAADAYEELIKGD